MGAGGCLYETAVWHTAQPPPLLSLSFLPCAGSQQFELDAVMGLVEPPMAATLELQRLRGFDQVPWRCQVAGCRPSMVPRDAAALCPHA